MQDAPVSSSSAGAELSPGLPDAGAVMQDVPVSCSSAGRGEWSPHRLDAAAQETASRASHVLKWGRCPCCDSGMSPWVYSSGLKKGRLVLLCNKFQKRSSSGQRLCWTDKPFPWSRINEAPAWVREQFGGVYAMLQKNAVR